MNLEEFKTYAEFMKKYQTGYFRVRKGDFSLVLGKKTLSLKTSNRKIT